MQSDYYALEQLAKVCCFISTIYNKVYHAITIYANYYNNLATYVYGKKHRYTYKGYIRN